MTKHDMTKINLRNAPTTLKLSIYAIIVLSVSGSFWDCKNWQSNRKTVGEGTKVVETLIC